MTQFFVHRIADVDAAVGHNPVGHGRGGDAFVPPFRRYLIPNAVQGEKKITLLLETDDFAAVSRLVGVSPNVPLGVATPMRTGWHCLSSAKQSSALDVFTMTFFF
ncbi:Uncharacterised protein [Neisseria meningitidis]|nr:Uncharacterised protein [Neisseria meningitidis]